MESRAQEFVIRGKSWVVADANAAKRTVETSCGVEVDELCVSVDPAPPLTLIKTPVPSGEFHYGTKGWWGDMTAVTLVICLHRSRVRLAGALKQVHFLFKPLA
jgi:hypothetical protein